MIFGKLTSLIVVWGIMMNIFHPLAHAMTLDSSPADLSYNHVATSQFHYGESEHHKEDFGNKHCDVCHISTMVFIIGDTVTKLITQDLKQQLALCVIPINAQSFLIDQPPQSLI